MTQTVDHLTRARSLRKDAFSEQVAPADEEHDATRYQILAAAAVDALIDIAESLRTIAAWAGQGM